MIDLLEYLQWVLNDRVMFALIHGDWDRERIEQHHNDVPRFQVIDMV